MMTEEQLESQKKEWWVKFPELGECDVIFFVEPPKKGGATQGSVVWLYTCVHISVTGEPMWFEAQMHISCLFGLVWPQPFLNLSEAMLDISPQSGLDFSKGNFSGPATHLILFWKSTTTHDPSPHAWKAKIPRNCQKPVKTPARLDLPWSGGGDVPQEQPESITEREQAVGGGGGDEGRHTRSLFRGVGGGGRAEAGGGGARAVGGGSPGAEGGGTGGPGGGGGGRPAGGGKGGRPSSGAGVGRGGG